MNRVVMIDMEKHIYSWEPWFFIFFGLFHMHRIWALLDRSSYASFWMGIMHDKGWPYFLIMGILAGLCILGIVTLSVGEKSTISGAGSIFSAVAMSFLTCLPLPPA